MQLDDTKKRTLGRPTDYTADLGDEICARLADGNSLSTVCAAEDMPSERSVYRWLRLYSEFCQNYTRAKVESQHALVERLDDVGTEAIGAAKVVDPKAASGVVNAYKLRADNIKWYLSKINPKKYGDSVKLEGGDNPVPLQILGGATAAIAQPKADPPPNQGA